MNVSLYQAAAAMQATDRWQELIAQNLASSSVPGYKQQNISFAALTAGQLPVNGAAGVRNYTLPAAQASVNFQAGQLKPTGVLTDVALDGTGFFGVQLPGGDTAYTRDGEFHIDAQGQLVTKQGYPVQGDGGAIQFDLNNPAPIAISADGTISQGADLKGKLQITTFNDPNLLTGLSNGCYLAQNPNLQTAPAGTTTVRQGYLESSNVSPVTEMAHLITAMRHFEANQRLMQIHDDRMSRTISELGNPNP